MGFGRMTVGGRKRTIQVCIRLPVELHEKLAREGAKIGDSPTTAAAKIIAGYLTR